MTRPLRVEYPGAFYHVYSRGNAREKVFNGKRDKTKFLEYLCKVTERFSVSIHTYSIMSNHYRYFPWYTQRVNKLRFFILV